MKLTHRTKIAKNRLSIRIRIDMTADDLACHMAGIYLANNGLPRAIPADPFTVVEQAVDGFSLYGLSAAVSPGAPGYPAEDHDALVTYLSRALGIKEDEDEGHDT